jgi:hypothetical protein
MVPKIDIEPPLSVLTLQPVVPPPVANPYAPPETRQPMSSAKMLTNKRLAAARKKRLARYKRMRPFAFVGSIISGGICGIWIAKLILDYIGMAFPTF